MQLQPAHVAETRIVHLTHTTLVIESLCGEQADIHGEPDLPVLCDECFVIALRAGADVSSWLTDIAGEVVLPLAA